MEEIIQIPSEGCLIPGCKRWLKEGSRGMCCNHRAIWGERVKRGVTTWEELEKRGLARKKLTREENIKRRNHPKGMRRYV